MTRANAKIEPMTGAVRDDLWCMFRQGPIWDGNLPSKSGRTWLFDRGYVARGDGWNWLTTEGVLLALELGMGLEKEKRR